jgi:polysaccharide pyruvyl transferase WcaK-like protein
MLILVDSGNYFAKNNNHGDRAIYTIIARRLNHLWPNCTIRWITRNEYLINTSTGNIYPLVLTRDRHPLPLERIKRISERFALRTLPRTILWRHPNGKNSLNILGHNPSTTDSQRIVSAILNCDFVLATGGGYFNDYFPNHAWSILDTLEAAEQLRKPTFILSAGFEPTRNLSLSNKMLSVLPKVNLISCREPTQSSTVIRSFSVKQKQIAITGDDAVELAFETHPSSLGKCLGINLRKADYSGVDSYIIASIRVGLQQIASNFKVPILPLPISMTGPSDPVAICELLEGILNETDGGKLLNTPESVIKQAGQCRLVITGSYHAAVFALSQGISVVALAASPHYKAKLEGLKALFGAGCNVLMLNRNLTNEVLIDTIQNMWEQADANRPILLKAAKQQIEANQAAYSQMHKIVDLSVKAPQAQESTLTFDPLLLLQSKSSRYSLDMTDTNVITSVLEQDSNLKRPNMQLTIPPAFPEFRLSPEEIALFRSQGFLGPFTAFDAKEMERVQQIIYDRVLPTPTQYCPFGLRVRHLDSKTIYDLCSNSAILGRIKSLFGPNIILWNSNIFNKPPAKIGSMEEYPWHQDYYNWHMDPILNVSAWLAITPATAENGCVEVIPGSHKMFIPAVRDTESHFSMRFGGVASDPAYIDESQKVALTLKPGQFFIFNERILHHSNPNMTKTSRLGLAMRFTVPIAEVSEPFPCTLISGEDQMGFNRYVDKPKDEPDMDWVSSLPDGHDFTFDRLIPGMGWHLIENNGTHNFAWTGLEPKAWIDFRPLISGDYTLRIEVIHMLSSEAINDLHVSVNGHIVNIVEQYVDVKMNPSIYNRIKNRLKIPTKAKTSQNAILILEARVSGQILNTRNDRVRVTIEVPNSKRSCDINSASLDKRTLGLGISRISITPAI